MSSGVAKWFSRRKSTATKPIAMSDPETMNTRCNDFVKALTTSLLKSLCCSRKASRAAFELVPEVTCGYALFGGVFDGLLLHIDI